MAPLRKQMIAAMRQRGFSVRTHKSYLAAVSDLARFHGRSPAELNVADLQGDHLAQERELSGASCRLYLNGIRCLYLHVLKRPSFDVSLVVPKRAQRVPELLTRAEVQGILGACTNPKHRMLLQITYGCGLRVSGGTTGSPCGRRAPPAAHRARQGRQGPARHSRARPAGEAAPLVVSLPAGGLVVSPRPC